MILGANSLSVHCCNPKKRQKLGTLRIWNLIQILTSDYQCCLRANYYSNKPLKYLEAKSNSSKNSLSKCSLWGLTISSNPLTQYYSTNSHTTSSTTETWSQSNTCSRSSQLKNESLKIETGHRCGSIGRLRVRLRRKKWHLQRQRLKHMATDVLETTRN